MNDSVLHGFYQKVRPLPGLTLIGLLLFSGCISFEGEKWCEELGGETGVKGSALAGLHNYCIIDGIAKEYICSSEGKCAFIEKKVNS